MRNTDQEKKNLFHTSGFYLFFFDIFAVNFAYFFALLLRFDFRFHDIPEIYFSGFAMFAPFYSIFCIFIFYLLKLYRSIWRFASYDELIHILVASLLSAVFQVAGTLLFLYRMPISYYLTGAIVQLFLLVGMRFSVRLIHAMRVKLEKKDSLHAMVIGSGSTAQLIVKELKSSPDILVCPVCIIDDNPNLWGRSIEGVPFVGGADSIPEMVEKYKIDRIIYADPNAAAEDKKRVMGICEETGCDVQTFTGYYRMDSSDLPVRELLKRIDGRIVFDINGERREYANAESAFASLGEKYRIHRILAEEDAVVIKLSKDFIVPNDLSAKWVEEFYEVNGEMPGFF